MTAIWSTALLMAVTVTGGGATSVTSDLERVRSVLANSRWGDLVQLPAPDSVGELVYTSHLELGLGKQLSLVVINEPRRSHLILFGLPSGRLLQKKRMPEVVSVALADLDADGVWEVLIDTIDEWGTGVLSRRFHLLRFTAADWKELWSGVSHSYDGGSSTEGSVLLGSPTFRSLVYSISTKGSGKEVRTSTCLMLEGEKMELCSGSSD